MAPEDLFLLYYFTLYFSGFEPETTVRAFVALLRLDPYGVWTYAPMQTINGKKLPDYNHIGQLLAFPFNSSCQPIRSLLFSSSL
jgi:hypothetical protein